MSPDSDSRPSPFFAEFQRRYPAIEVRLNADTRSLNLMNAEADIALYPTAPPPEYWVGRKLAAIECGQYAQRTTGAVLKLCLAQSITGYF